MAPDLFVVAAELCSFSAVGAPEINGRFNLHGIRIGAVTGGP